LYPVSDRFLAVGKDGLRGRLEQYGDVRDHETQASVHGLGDGWYNPPPAGGKSALFL
jgi:hypothetical protein